MEESTRPAAAGTAAGRENGVGDEVVLAPSIARQPRAWLEARERHAIEALSRYGFPPCRQEGRA
jgi:hypothetical protein